jgi:hypothetical protein
VCALVLDSAGARRLAANAPLITDDDNRIATSSVYEQGRGMSGESSGRILAGYDPLQRADSEIYSNLRPYLSFQYLARRNGVFVLIDPSLTDRVGRMAQILGATPDGEYARAFYYRMRRDTQRSMEMFRLAIDQYPGDVALRQEFLRDHFGDLARGGADPDITSVANALDGTSGELLAAARQAAKADWSAVAMADDRLAEIPWADGWYPEALELRINWRTRVTNGDKARHFADQAIPMIDRLTIMNPTLNLYGMRTRAGFAAQRPAVVVESVSNYVRLASGMVRAGVLGVEALRKDATALRDILKDAEKMQGADAPRIAEVRAEIARLVPAS